MTGSIDASGERGGTINLYANNGVTLLSGANLTVAGQQFDAAGKGGLVEIESRGGNNGLIGIQTGSTINLSVAGSAGGTLHLRAPQTITNNDLLIRSNQRKCRERVEHRRGRIPGL